MNKPLRKCRMRIKALRLAVQKPVVIMYVLQMIIRLRWMRGRMGKRSRCLSGKTVCFQTVR